jgi:hypothetical protein
MFNHVNNATHIMVDFRLLARYVQSLIAITAMETIQYALSVMMAIISIMELVTIAKQIV